MIINEGYDTPPTPPQPWASDTRGEIRLDIGSGGPSSDDKFIGVDPYADGAPVKAFMWDLPYEDSTVDAIFTSNALEHVEKKMIVPSLKEFYRVLRHEGRLQIIVPDLAWICQWWLQHQSTSWDMDIIFGHQAHEGEFHKTGFTPNILSQYFYGLRFVTNKIEYMGGTEQLELNGRGEMVIHVQQRLINLEAWAYKPGS